VTDWFLSTDAGRTPWGGWDWNLGWAQGVVGYAIQATFLYGLVCGVDAVRRRPKGTIERARARAYVQAFALIDVVVIASNGSFIGEALASAFSGLGETLPFLESALVLAGALLIVRGLLRYQLFDFDLKVKWTLKRGTIAAIILGAAVVTGQVAQNYLSGALGWLAGGVVAGILVFAFKPIERLAERVSDRAMPRTTGTPEYVAFRKLEVYKAAVESAHETGGITQRERASLDRLRAKLAIAEADAASIEADVTGPQVVTDVHAA
jgi:hypothetical protein